MKAEYSAEAVNTLHWIPTGIFYTNKKGETKEKKRKVVHRRLFLTALPGVKIFGSRNLRIVRVRRNGEVSYSLSEKKETPRPWWEKAPPTVAREYTRTKHSGNGKVEPPITEAECIRFLSACIGSEAAGLVFAELENGEALEGDARWTALEKYGYERPEYEDEALAA